MPATSFNKTVLSMDYTISFQHTDAVLQPPASEKARGHLVAGFGRSQGFSLEEPVASEQFRPALGGEGIRIYWSHCLRLQNLQRQEERLPSHILGLTRLYDNLQVTDTIADRYAELVRVDNATERLPLPLALRRFGEQVVILGK